MEAEALDQLVAAGPPGATPIPRLATISADALQRKEIPPLTFAVENLIPAGLSILCGAPKQGKSWMALGLCLAITMGEPFLEHPTTKSACLYLAMEDNERRLKTRLERLLDGNTAPANFHIATIGSTIDTALFDELEGFLKEHPGTGLIIIDTLQMVRGIGGSRDIYGTDYRDLTLLKRFADGHDIALLLVHHLRKMRDDSDPFNMIAGSNGIMGSADTTIVLTKEQRNDGDTIMHVTGRDVETTETILRFEPATCQWIVLGAAQPLVSREQQRYEGNPVVRTIKALLAQAGKEGWVGTMGDLLAAGQDITGTQISNSTRALSAQLSRLDDLLYDDGINHERIPHGTGGGKHRFSYITIDNTTSASDLTISF